MKKDLSTLHFNYYLSEMIKKFTFKIFWFNLLFFLVLFLAGSVLFFFHAPVLLITVILFLISVSVLFVPQAIVIDEEDLGNSFSNNFEFFRKNFFSFAYVLVTAVILLAVVQLVEFAVDMVLPIGPYVSIVISLVFIVPYIEVMKTYLYMLKYDLIRNPDLLHRKKKNKPLQHRR